MLPKITEDELHIFTTLSHPVAATEILFSNLGNLSEFEESKKSEVRKYQYHFLSWDTLFFENKKLNDKENYNIKKELGEIFILGGRLTGKSRLGLVVDVILALLHSTVRIGCVSSADAKKIQKVMEDIFVALEFHPFFKLFKMRVKRNPYQIMTPNGTCIESVNDNIAGKNPGSQYHGRHDEKNWQEESSYLTHQVTREKLMAQSENGCIRHWSGMTIFSKESPLGHIFYDIKNENKVVNLPSYVNPTWDAEKDEAAEREFGGKSSVGYKTQVKGEIVENGESVYDILKIRETYIRDKEGTPQPIQSFELNSKNFNRYKDIIIVERPVGVDKLLINIDIGEGGAPSEYIVITQTNGIYKYIYNITTFKLSPDEEKEFVKYLMKLLKVNMLGLDITSGVGKAIYSDIVKIYPKNIQSVSFNENIDIDFDYIEGTNKIKRDKEGKPIFKQARIDDWSIQQLKQIFYAKKIKCYFDMKLDTQFDNVIAGKTKQGKVMYACKVANHLHQAFQVFAIVHWLTEWKKIQPVSDDNLITGYSESI